MLVVLKLGEVLAAGADLQLHSQIKVIIRLVHLISRDALSSITNVEIRYFMKKIRYLRCVLIDCF